MIGPLRHKLERLTMTRQPDTGGGAATIWQSTGEVWARVEFLTPIRDLSGDRRSFLRRLAAEIRYEHDVMPGERIRYNASDYEIVSIETIDERQRRLVLICEEVLPV